MGVNTDQLKRFFKIDDKIKHGKKATIKQLAAAWNNSRSDDVDKVTDRTIYTDINAIPKVFEGAKIEIIGVIHFIGGAFAGAAPHITYRYIYIYIYIYLLLLLLLLLFYSKL